MTVQGPVIFLDIDGVLNDHTHMENMYCGTKPSCVKVFNSILDSLPTAKIVISSAWRYMMLRGELTVGGFEMLLLTHGVKCHGRVIGHTDADGPVDEEPSHLDVDSWNRAGLKWRREQIRDWVAKNNVLNYVVIDDLDLEMHEQYRTVGTVGLTPDCASKVLELVVSQSSAHASS